ncbi:MAG: sulfatase-like hydrolase/transferase [Edaphobacter sp.]
MDRRKFIGLMTTGIAAANAPSALALAPKQPKQSERPNFLFIIADDLMYRTIHALNNHEVQTPNLDRLANSGCAFTHCFHQGSWSPAVCLPSRTMLNTGLSAFHAESGVDHVQTWGQTLGSAGYDTYICGKWHLDPTVLQRSFQQMGPIAPGMLPSTPFPGPAYDRPSAGDTWQPWDTSQKGHWLHTKLWESKSPDTIEHSSVVYANGVIDHLTNQVPKSDAPFFIYLGFNAPHDPRQSPKESLALYSQDKIEIPPNFLPEHPFDQGDYKIRDEILAPFPRTHEAVQLHRHEYYSIISHMDHQMGRIFDALEKSGKASNTYVILTADHGLAVGEHGLMGKQNMYDCSIRMPLLISGPGIAAGKRVDELVYQHSMFATTCELAGIEVPKTVEFPSLVPLVRGESHPVHDAVFSYYRDFQRTVRTKTHKLIVYPQIQRIQIFDMVKDPWEMHDLSTDPGIAPVKAQLMKRLLQFQHELDDKLSLGAVSA